MKKISVLVSAFLSNFVIQTVRVEAATLISDPQFSVTTFDPNTQLILQPGETRSFSFVFEAQNNSIFSPGETGDLEVTFSFASDMGPFDDALPETPQTERRLVFSSDQQQTVTTGPVTATEDFNITGGQPGTRQTFGNTVKIDATFNGMTATRTLSQNITFQTVPEPFTILGSVTALGIGAVLKREHAKRLRKAKARSVVESLHEKLAKHS